MWAYSVQSGMPNQYVYLVCALWLLGALPAAMAMLKNKGLAQL